MNMNMDIKEMLKNGCTEDELLKSFQEHLKEAKAEIAAEQPTELDYAREAMIESIIDYLLELGVITEDENEDVTEHITSILKESEKQFLAYVNFMKKMKTEAKATKATDDEALNSFLKQLCR